MSMTRAEKYPEIKYPEDLKNKIKLFKESLSSEAEYRKYLLQHADYMTRFAKDEEDIEITDMENDLKDAVALIEKIKKCQDLSIKSDLVTVTIEELEEDLKKFWEDRCIYSPFDLDKMHSGFFMHVRCLRINRNYTSQISIEGEMFFRCCEDFGSVLGAHRSFRFMKNGVMGFGLTEDPIYHELTKDQFNTELSIMTDKAKTGLTVE